jgi:hypothetical protein
MEDIEKTYLNKDLIGSRESFYDAVTNDFIGSDFADQLEWAMLITQSKFNQIRFADYMPTVTRNHFDKAYLMTASLNENQKFFNILGSFQANPEIFPNLNIKTMTIGETISLSKVKEIPYAERRNLIVKKRYAFERSVAFYNKKTEAFYGKKEGYEVDPSFFNFFLKEKKSVQDLPNPISLHPGYYIPQNSIIKLDNDEIVDIIKNIAMSYQVAFSNYYEWSIYIKEYDNIGLIIPIEPGMLSEIYKTSLLKFDCKKSMIHFVRDHYRRKPMVKNDDYSVYVKKYLRGEHKFNYNGFSAEIIPPKYELNRIATKKKFINPFE